MNLNKKIPEIPLLYLWIHHKLLEQKQPIMLRKNILEIVRRNVRLPSKKFNREILMELELYELLIPINKKRGYNILQKKFIVEDPFF